MRDIAFGQYYPTGSPIHRLDPRAKLVFSLLYMVFIFFAKSYVAYLAIFTFIVVVTLISKVPFRALLKSVKIILVLLIFTGLLNLFMYRDGNILGEWWIFRITDKGIDFSIKIMLRLSFLIVGTSMLTFTTTPTEMTDGIEWLLNPLKYIKIPVHDIALTMSIALRFIPSLMEETDKIIMAQKARGAAFDTGKLHERAKSLIPILIPLFVSALRRADELADALDARCYNATPHRTKMKKLAFSYRDAIAFLILASLICFIMVDAYYFTQFVPVGHIASGLDYYVFSWISGLIA